MKRLCLSITGTLETFDADGALVSRASISPAPIEIACIQSPPVVAALAKLGAELESLFGDAIESEPG